jgi:hypothetical protein
MKTSIEKARDHVRKKGHTLGCHEGKRPWQPITIFCADCGVRWSVLRQDAPHSHPLVAQLNATERELPTFWERLLSDDISV